MTVVKWIRQKSRLSALVGQSGGMTIGKALEHAAVNLDEIRDEAVVRINDCVTLLESKAAEPQSDARWLDGVYELSSAVLKAVGPLGYEGLCRAAYSLCELADRMKPHPQAATEPVRVHTGAMRLLFANPDLPAAAQEEILGGLNRVLAKAPTPAES